MGYIKFSVVKLDGNHHGPGFSTLRRTWQIVRMESYAKTWTLYIYRGDGRTIGMQVCFPRWLGEWPGARP